MTALFYRFVLLSAACLFAAFLFHSCCFEKKCRGSEYFVSFRLADKANTNADLLFGATKKYDWHTIKFYSLKGTDSVFHWVNAYPVEYNSTDSFISVHFSSQKSETVFIKLSDQDIDTLKVTYPIVSHSQCCGEAIIVKPATFNNGELTGLNGVYQLRK